MSNRFKPAANTYVRPMTGWWKRNPYHRRYMLREATALFVTLYALNLLEGFNLREMGHNSTPYLHAVTESLKLAFADRNLYLADSDFVRVPVKGLLDSGYLTVRAQQIRLGASMEKAAAGNPADALRLRRGHPFTHAAIALMLLDPVVQRLRRAANLAGDRLAAGPL